MNFQEITCQTHLLLDKVFDTVSSSSRYEKHLYHKITIVAIRIWYLIWDLMPDIKLLNWVLLCLTDPFLVVVLVVVAPRVLDDGIAVVGVVTVLGVAPVNGSVKVVLGALSCFPFRLELGVFELDVVDLLAAGFFGFRKSNMTDWVLFRRIKVSKKWSQSVLLSNWAYWPVVLLATVTLGLVFFNIGRVVVSGVALLSEVHLVKSSIMNRAKWNAVVFRRRDESISDQTVQNAYTQALRKSDVIHCIVQLIWNIRHRFVKQYDKTYLILLIVAVILTLQYFNWL